VSHMDDVLKKALILADPESLFKNKPESVEPKDEPPGFEEKEEEGPGAHILPQ